MNPDTKSKRKKVANNSRLMASPEQESVKPSKTPYNGTTLSQTTPTPNEGHRKIAVPEHGHAKSRDHIEGQKAEDWRAVEAEIKKLLANS